MRVVVIGANGQLGQDLMAVGQSFDSIELVGYTRPGVDVTDTEKLDHAFARDEPDVVINTAAWTDVAGCERDPRRAYSVNAVGCLNAARAASQVGARSVMISTDYVFGDSKAEPEGGERVTSATGHVESDLPNPLNVYGASKLAGEHLSRIGATQEPLVCRLSSVFGTAGARGKGGNFIESILGKAAKGESLNIVNDQWMTPTYTRDAAEAILHLAVLGEAGTFHVTSPCACTWFDLASKALELCDLVCEVTPVGHKSYASDLERPSNSALVTRKLAKRLGSPLRSWEDALRHYLGAKGHMDRRSSDDVEER